MDIAVLGMGRVGAVAAACLAEAGHQVLGIDIDGGRVRGVAEGRSGFYEPDLSPLLGAMISGGALAPRTAGRWRGLMSMSRVLDGRNALPPDLLRKPCCRYLGVGRGALSPDRVKDGKALAETVGLAEQGAAEQR